MSDSEYKPYIPPAPRAKLPSWVWIVSGCGILIVLVTAIFLAVLFPVAKLMRDKSRESKRSAVCIDNLRQIASAMSMYAQDYDDRLPLANNWSEGIEAYKGSSNTDKGGFQCPEVKQKNPKGYGYAFNSLFAGKPLSKIKSSPTEYFVYDSSNLDKNATDPVTSLPNPPRHNVRAVKGKRNTRVNMMCFADSHVKTIKKDMSVVNSVGNENE